MQPFLNNITSHPKQIFLIDALGAVLSAFSLGVVLVQLEAYFGMPKNILYILAGIAAVFAIYSFVCYFFSTKIWRPHLLKGIMVANLLYCCLTLILVLYFYQQLTILGWIYFLLEMLIIVVLVRVEKEVHLKLSVSGMDEQGKKEKI